ncbi:MAG: hypothetical protein ACYTFY_12480 [Planctomycetota bacterium]|jgi:hypothetical protein
MIKSINYKGPYILDLPIEGCRKSDNVMPSHPKGIMLSKDRYLVVLGSRGYLGVDDDREIVYQVRKDFMDGEVLNQGKLTETIYDWDPLNRGDKFLKSTGTPIPFGVPKGAKLNGEVMPHENVFVIKWYAYPKIVEDGKHLIDDELTKEIIRTEWIQCRLNDAEDDIEIIHGPERMRQVGYEEGEHFSSLESLTKCMNHSIIPPVPYNDDFTEWAEVDHFYSGILAPVLFRFNKDKGLYEWVETGPASVNAENKYSEANLCRVGDGWLIAARTGPGGGRTAWFKSNDLFGKGLGEVTYSGPCTYGPRMMFTCPDGVVRIYSGDKDESPYGEKRNPLFSWDVDSETFELSNKKVIFDFYEKGFYERNDPRLEGSQGPFAGFTMLSPWDGEKHILTHRMLKGASYTGLEKGEPDTFGSYYSEITYEEEIPPLWKFN